MNEKTFTASQREAIESDRPDIAVLAGPGSGKTEVFTQRIKRLIYTEHFHPSEIIALTFTNAAAREIEKRVGNPFLGYCGTLHGFALKMLKEYGETMGYGDRMTVINPANAADLLASKAESLGCKLAVEKLTLLKAEIGRPTPGKLSIPETVIAAYYDDLRDAGMVDFDVLLTEFARMIEETDAVHGRFKHLLVDEIQDSAGIDWRIYRGLQIPNKFFVGDPDQAIYSFRGGNVLGLLTYLQKNGVQQIRLEENFRSREPICAAANALISNNAKRVAKKTVSMNGSLGSQVHTMPGDRNAGAEIATVIDLIQDIGTEDDGSIAVLARSNHLANEFRAAINAAGFVVNKHDERTEPKDFHLARTLIELLVYPDNDTLAFFYMIAIARKNGASEIMARKQAHQTRRDASAKFKSINQLTLGFAHNLPAFNATKYLDTEGISLESQMLIADKLRELPDNVPMIELAFLLAMNPKPAERVEDDVAIIQVLTMHAAKGREFDIVFLVGCEDETIPGHRKNSDTEEERRLFYVGVTRARRQLYVTWSKSRITPWKALVACTPSRFIAEMDDIPL